jgi:hypothetical protein
MAMPELAGLGVSSSPIKWVRRQGWERFRLLSAHASLLHLSQACLLALAGRPCLGGGAHDRGSRRRLCFEDEDDLLHSGMRIVQNPYPATIVHSLAVKIQEAGSD